MKQWMLIGLLAASAASFAQNATVEKDTAKQEAEDAKTRAKLEEARARLDKAAREVAELSTQLGASARHDVRFFAGGPPRAVLGIQVDPRSDEKGVRILSVSPGGAAAEAGLRESDVIVSLDGKPMTGPDSDRTLITQMRAVKPDQKVKVRVLRDGKNKDLTVVARPMVFEDRVFTVRGGPEAGMRQFGGATMVGPMGEVRGDMHGDLPMVRSFRAFFPGEFGGMELASITPKLGAYFGVTEGVLVVQAPDNDAFKLEDGDVLQSIDGRKPEDGGHALRILRSYKSGEKLNLTVLRQRKPLTLAVTMPERQDMGDTMMFDSMMPPMPAMPAIPATPAVPALPGGQGGGAATLD